MRCAHQWSSQTLAPKTAMKPQASIKSVGVGKPKFLLEGEVPLGKGQESGHGEALPLRVWAGVPALWHWWKCRPEASFFWYSGWAFHPAEPPAALSPLFAGWLLGQAEPLFLPVSYNATYRELTPFQAWGGGAGCGSRANYTLPWA